MTSAPAPAPGKTYGVRLPLQLAARFEALCEMYPTKAPADLLADVVGLGLAQLEQRWPQVAAVPAGGPADRRPPIYLLSGPFDEFHGLVLKHHTALEHERAGEAAETLLPLDAYRLDDLS